MKVLVFGAGATGSLLGARLHAAGFSVHLVGRPDHVRAIRTDGLSVEGLDGSPFRIPATEKVPEGSRFDRILFTVKAPDIEAGAQALGQSLVHPAPLLAVQNGLGIQTRTQRALRAAGWAYSEKWVTRGIQILGATLLGPGRVRRASPTEEIVLGTPGPDGALNGFDALLRIAGIDVRLARSIDEEEWRKAMVNAAVNPITADHSVPNGRLVDDPLRGQALALLEEARTVAAASGFPFPREQAEQEFFRVVRGSASNRSSMLQDLDRGRPTEIDAISGEILRRGASLGLALPNTRRIVARIEARGLTAPPAGTPPGPAQPPAARSGRGRSKRK